MQSNFPTAVLLMAYGTPNSPEEIEPYYTDIRGGRKPTPQLLQELTERYERIGGRTPLLEITRAQARGLQERLAPDYKVYIGMKHWHPYIAQAVQEIANDGLTHCIALALAPHYSRFSIDGYVQRVRDAAQLTGAPIEFAFIESWNDHPLFLRMIADHMQQARGEVPNPNWSGISVVFSAHSLPERILQSGDPYPAELRETCEGVASLLGLKDWTFAFQSAGRTGEKWLGPDILDKLKKLATQGKTQVLIAPIGFVADHLEVLFDIDVECAERAKELGLEMHRIESPNADPEFIDVLEAIVRGAK
jgi:ferrochelatase